MKPNLIAAIVLNEFYTSATVEAEHPVDVQTFVFYVLPERTFTFVI